MFIIVREIRKDPGNQKNPGNRKIREIEKSTKSKNPGTFFY